MCSDHSDGLPVGLAVDLAVLRGEVVGHRRTLAMRCPLHALSLHPRIIMRHIDNVDASGSITMSIRDVEKPLTGA